MAQLGATQGLVAVIASLSIAFFAYKIFASSRQPKSSHPLPPGPKPQFLVGNLSDLPSPGAREWEHWRKLGDQYGPITSLTVLGQTMIIISDYKIAVHLMDKRSAITSSRPHMEFGSKMCGWEDLLALQPYNSQMREYRKAMHTVLGTSSAIEPFQPLVELETRRFLLKILEKPQDVLQLIRTQAGAIILKIAYDYTIEPRESDPLVDLADEALVQFSRACSPGAWMVDMIPALKYLPDWVPGTGFKRTARLWKATLQAVADRPYAFVEKRMRSGKAGPSYLSKLLRSDSDVEKAKKPLSPFEDHVARWSAASLYTGGADTTVSSVACFVLAMTLFPEVQKKAQAEIDAVIGTRLPTFSDRKNLPYIDATVKEVLRWQPVAPMGLPHKIEREDIIYDDTYRLPKESLLIPNIYAMLHDPSIYASPGNFDPSRFLASDTHTPEPDPHNLSFGFGRRICPGRLFADTTLFSTIASFLAVFEVRKKLGPDGREVEPVVDFQPGIISHPKPFECDIRVRSDEWERLVRSIEVEHPWPEHGDAKELDGMGVDGRIIL